jgi:hypothetical protein
MQTRTRGGTRADERDSQSPIFNHEPPDQDGLHGLALELPVASCPPGQGAWLGPLLIRVPDLAVGSGVSC